MFSFLKFYMCTQTPTTDTKTLGEIADLVDKTFDKLSGTRRNFNRAAADIYRFDRSAFVDSAFANFWTNRCRECSPGGPSDKPGCDWRHSKDPAEREREMNVIRKIANDVGKPLTGACYTQLSEQLFKANRKVETLSAELVEAKSDKDVAEIRLNNFTRMNSNQRESIEEYQKEIRVCEARREVAEAERDQARTELANTKKLLDESIAAYKERKESESVVDAYHSRVAAEQNAVTSVSGAVKQIAADWAKVGEFYGREPNQYSHGHPGKSCAENDIFDGIQYGRAQERIKLGLFSTRFYRGLCRDLARRLIRFSGSARWTAEDQNLCNRVTLNVDL